MKYFKYRNISKVQQLAYKERLASLGKDEQKKIKRQVILSSISVSCLVVGLIYITCVILEISPELVNILFTVFSLT